MANLKIIKNKQTKKSEMYGKNAGKYVKAKIVGI